MLAQFELDESWLPRVVRAGTDLGPLDSRAAAQFGLPESCRFVVGCLDQYAGAIGAGNIEPGMVSETTGTVLATVQCADQFGTKLGPAVYQGPAFRQGLYWRMAFGDVSANYLQWYHGQLPDRPTSISSPPWPRKSHRGRRAEAANRCRAHRARTGVCGHDGPTWAGPCGAVHHGDRGGRAGWPSGSPLPGFTARRDSLRRRRGSQRVVAANQGRRAGPAHRGDRMFRAHEPGCSHLGRGVA